ncbi:membrane lipoprotein lipid attachment site-containing protein [Hymenobacter perfusus]|uniref:Type IV secretion system putative lipoprotein virB7 n=1 Tax=Hymenobacter perfusus TaxID=1236770 RepID=A0A428KHR8_9BACT|nr:membrane lipoprotein lipid attachment site-containing protein [Hymenobacter perfusus]RSK45999.1 hypothetical protein EI293_02145 [Hymenobacter perfusus]
MKKILFGAGLLASLTACSKKETSPAIDFGPERGITERDASNRSIGPTDPTDWARDETWNEQELGLFKLPLYLNVTPAVTVQPRNFYPNPATIQGGGNFGFYGIPSGAMLKLVFVDKNYRVANELEYGPFSVSDILFHFEFPADKFKPNTTYRVYYVIYSPTQANLYLKGHGDIAFGG